MRSTVVAVAALVAFAVVAEAAVADSLDDAVNSSRGSALPNHPELERTAQGSAARQVATGEASHASLGHLSSVCDGWGEVVGTGPSLDAIFDLFRQSSLHWSTITDPSWTAMGTGMAKDDAGMLYVSVVFCIASGSEPAPPSTTTTTSPPREQSEPAPAAPKAMPEPQPAPGPHTHTVEGVSISVAFGPSPAVPMEEWERSEDPTVT